MIKSARSPKSIMIIDDDDDLRNVVRLIMSQEGYRVYEASNGKEALEGLKTITPDLIVLDLRMPVMDGWEFSKRYAHEIQREVPIIVMTAADKPRERTSETNATAVISKPFDVKDLKELISKVLKIYSST